MSEKPLEGMTVAVVATLGDGLPSTFGDQLRTELYVRGAQVVAEGSIRGGYSSPFLFNGQVGSVESTHEWSIQCSVRDVSRRSDVGDISEETHDLSSLEETFRALARKVADRLIFERRRGELTITSREIAERVLT